LSSAPARAGWLGILAANIFFGALIMFEAITYFMFHLFAYDRAEEIRMVLQMFASMLWVYGSLKMFDARGTGKVFVIVGALLFFLMGAIRIIFSTHSVVDFDRYFLLATFLWVSMNCLVVPRLTQKK
jgi:hypothetical protein